MSVLRSDGTHDFLTWPPLRNSNSFAEYDRSNMPSNPLLSWLRWHFDNTIHSDKVFCLTRYVRNGWFPINLSGHPSSSRYNDRFSARLVGCIESDKAASVFLQSNAFSISKMSPLPMESLLNETRWGDSRNQSSPTSNSILMDPAWKKDKRQHIYL